MLPQSYTGNEVGRVTLGAAKALLVKCISLSINGGSEGYSISGYRQIQFDGFS